MTARPLSLSVLLICLTIVFAAALAAEVRSEPSVTSSSPSARNAAPMLAHMVFFTLKESTPAGREKLAAACRQYLSDHEGTVYFSAGVRAEEFDRPVNDQEFDVALHVVFKDKAAHDKYQTAPRHLQFIDENKADWSSVRVFDSYVK